MWGRIRWMVLMLSAVAAISGVASESVRASEPGTAEASRGQATFRSFCASCHGKEALGDGPVAEYLDPRPADLTRISQRYDGTFPTDRIRQIVDGREGRPGHGSADMPVWGDALKVAFEGEDEDGILQKIDELVEFLRSIQVEE